MRAGTRSPDLAVIIPAHDEASLLGACLDSVRAALDHAGVADAEVIVVDDHSSDETSDVARAHGAVAIRQSRRRGQMAACSLGVLNSSASLLVFVDADCRVDKGAFSALMRGYTRPAIGIVAARSEPDTGLARGSTVERAAIFSATVLHEIKHRLVNHDFLPIGRLFALRRDAWQAGDDEQQPCDRIYASRAKRAGWDIVYEPEAVVYYQPTGTYQEFKSAYLRSVQTRARSRRADGLAEPLPWGVVGRAAAASVRRRPLSAAAWLALRTRLWSERAIGRAGPDERLTRSGVWDNVSPRSAGRPA